MTLSSEYDDSTINIAMVIYYLVTLQDGEMFRDDLKSNIKYFRNHINSRILNEMRKRHFYDSV